MATASTSTRPLAHVLEGWKRGGLVKIEGIPAPTGPMEVGCVDVMHRFSDDDRGLLVRLFYPTEPGLADTHQYAQWAPNHRYIKGYLDFLQLKMARFFSTIVRVLTSPKSPALYGTPLLKGDYSQSYRIQPLSLTKPQSSLANPNSSSALEPDTHKPEMQSTPEPEVHCTTGNGNAPPEAGDSEQSPPFSSQFPVIVFSHGMGGMRTTYTGICCDLASHGYVVASVEHRDGSACLSLDRVPVGTARAGNQQQYDDHWTPFYFLPKDEFPFRHKQVKKRSSDVRKALDLLFLLNEGGDIHNMMENKYNLGQFKGRLKVDMAAIMGHSFGGATTIQALSEDDRFKCGIGLDTWMYPVHRDLYKVGVSQPLLFINSGNWQWAENVRCMMQLARPANSNGISQCHVLTISGTEHKSQSDSNFVTPDVFRREPLPPLNRNVAHAINMDLCHAFLKRFFLEDSTYLQQPVANLDGGHGASEHIIFGSNVRWQETSAGDAENSGNGEKEGEAECVQNESGETIHENGQASPLSNGTSVAKTSSQEMNDDQAVGLQLREEEKLPETMFAPNSAENKLEENEGKDDSVIEEK